jgi:hypothetical protein
MPRTVAKTPEAPLAGGAPFDAEGVATAMAEHLAEAIAALIASKLADQIRPELLLGDDAVLNEAETSRALKKSRATLEAWRRTGIGPRSITLGPRAVGYTLGDLRQYIRWAAHGPLTPNDAVAK